MQNIVNCWLLKPVTSCMTLLQFLYRYLMFCYAIIYANQLIVFTLHSTAYIWPKIDCGDKSISLRHTFVQCTCYVLISNKALEPTHSLILKKLHA